MKLKISPRNSKIGNVPNLSLPPGTSCVPEVPCFIGGCYARNSYRRFKNVRTAWDSNLELYQKAPDTFFIEFENWLAAHDPKRFRVFVGGDFPDETFWERAAQMIGAFPGTKFLIFTKRYDYNYSFKPENCQIILSTWPGLALPTNTALPWAWLKEDSRRPEGKPYLACPGGCGDCNHKCWEVVSADLPVVFHKH